MKQLRNTRPVFRLKSQNRNNVDFSPQVLMERCNLIPVCHNNKLDPSESLVAMQLESVRLYFSDARGTLCSYNLVEVTMSTELLQFCHWRKKASLAEPPRVVPSLVCLIYSKGNHFSATIIIICPDPHLLPVLG